MKIPINIHISSLDRLYNDGLVTDKEYKVIMDRIVVQRIAERAVENNG